MTSLPVAVLWIVSVGLGIYFLWKVLAQLFETKVVFLTFLLTFLVISFLIFIPQFLYWKYLSGSYLFYSHGFHIPKLGRKLFLPLIPLNILVFP